MLDAPYVSGASSRVSAAERLTCPVVSDTYSGPATVTTDGGPEMPIQAVLRTRPGRNGLMAWAGSISTSGEEQSLWPVFEAGGATIRMPDGREARFAPEGFGDSAASTSEMAITGSGEKPF